MSDPDLTQRATFPFWSEEKIRFADIDRQNHVNNLAISSYIENGRIEMRERSFPHLARDRSIAWLVVNVETTYRASIGYPGKVEVGTGVLKIGNTSYVLGHGVFSGDLCVATGKTITVFGDSATGEKRNITDELREELEKLRAIV